MDYLRTQLRQTNFVRVLGSWKLMTQHLQGSGRPIAELGSLPDENVSHSVIVPRHT